MKITYEMLTHHLLEPKPLFTSPRHCILFDSRGARSTDGFALATIPPPKQESHYFPDEYLTPLDPSMLLSLKTIAFLKKNSNKNSEIVLFWDGGVAKARTYDTKKHTHNTFTIQVEDGAVNYPDYSRVIPDKDGEFDAVLTVTAAHLARVLEVVNAHALGADNTGIFILKWNSKKMEPVLVIPESDEDSGVVAAFMPALVNDKKKG